MAWKRSGVRISPGPPKRFKDLGPFPHPQLCNRGPFGVQAPNSIRLAIRSFFRSVALRDPGSIDMATRILAIPVKRWDHRLVGYRTRPEIDAILAAPATKTWTGRRDHALLLTLYNTGARVKERTVRKATQNHFIESLLLSWPSGSILLDPGVEISVGPRSASGSGSGISPRRTSTFTQ